jgi:hypothetical protein
LTEFTTKETEVFEFLDELRDSGVTNMFGASPYIIASFPELKRQEHQYLSKWMSTFEERHSEED